MSSLPAAEQKRECLRRELDSLRDLPTPSQVVHEIWRVLDDENTSAMTLAAVLSRDTALSGRTLRLANSAYFGLPNPVSDVRAACVVLGFETIRGLAVGVAALDGLTRPAARVLDIQSFWRHSIAAASAAQLLAMKLGVPETGTAFCAGMMHDLGRLVLAAMVPAEYGAVLRGATAAELRSQEMERLGAGHDEVGGWVAERWRLPAVLVDAIAHHHEPPADGNWGRWGALTHLADAMALRAGHVSVGALPEDPADIALSPDALAVLGLAESALPEVQRRLAEDLDRIDALAAAVQGAR